MMQIKQGICGIGDRKSGTFGQHRHAILIVINHESARQVESRSWQRPEYEAVLVKEVMRL